MDEMDAKEIVGDAGATCFVCFDLSGDLGRAQGRHPCCDVRVQIVQRGLGPDARLAGQADVNTKIAGLTRSRLLRARPADLELAALALVDEPVRPRVAEVADPVDERVVRLDHLERVLAVG